MVESDWNLQVFYDGDCPLCCKEISWLRGRTGEHAVLYTNIAAPDFDASEYQKSQDDLMREMHARLPNGEFIVGMDVFRHLYSEARLGFFLAPTNWPILKPLFDLFYKVFAKNRLRLTGRHCEISSCEVSNLEQDNTKIKSFQ